MEIYDFEGQPKDEEWLKRIWGVTITKPSDLGDNEEYFECRIIQITEGPCAIINTVYDDDPGPMADIMVAWYWPDAPYPPTSPHPPYTTDIYPHDWKNGQFEFGLTDAGGAWAGAMGRGAMVNEGGKGPHAVWIHHLDHRSDLVEGLGWRTGTNHRAPRLTWYRTRSSGPAPPQPPIEGRFVLATDPWSDPTEGVNRIRIEVQGERDLHDTRWSIAVCNINGEEGQFWEAGPHHPTEVRLIETGADYVPGEVEENRTFCITIETPQGTVIGGPYRFRCETGVGKIWHAIVEWKEEGEPEPPDPEPPGEVPPYEGSILDKVEELEEKVLALQDLDVNALLDNIAQIKAMLVG